MGERSDARKIRDSRVMAMKVEIDAYSGFCGGVIRAIGSAEEFLESPGHSKIYSLGPIVHNERELARLQDKGLQCIDIETLGKFKEGACDATLLIRAHGEPPETYKLAKSLGFDIVDCTCPVVLQLQRSILEAYRRVSPRGGKIVIFGKIGHAEVLGLVGQVGGDALVVENLHMLEKRIEDGTIDVDAPVELFSQTTKSPLEFEELSAYMKMHCSDVVVHDTICRQVKSRHSKLTEFAVNHDVVIFVAGEQSSNGKVLCSLCESANVRTYCVGAIEDLRKEWFRDGDSVGVCGATSTPKWLLEDIAEAIENFAI